MEHKQMQGKQSLDWDADQKLDDSVNRTFKESVWKGLVTGALCFTVIALVYVVVALIIRFGDAQKNILVLTLIGAGMGTGLFQQIWFNYQPFILRLSYFKRYLGFNACMFPMLVIMALIGSWLPALIEAWITFVGIYLMILLIMTLFFNQRFKRANAQYQEAFKKYQASRHA